MTAVLNTESIRAKTTKHLGNAESVFLLLIHMLAGGG